MKIRRADSEIEETRGQTELTPIGEEDPLPNQILIEMTGVVAEVIDGEEEEDLRIGVPGGMIGTTEVHQGGLTEMIGAHQGALTEMIEAPQGVLTEMTEALQGVLTEMKEAHQGVLIEMIGDLEAMIEETEDMTAIEVALIEAVVHEMTGILEEILMTEAHPEVLTEMVGGDTETGALRVEETEDMIEGPGIGMMIEIEAMDLGLEEMTEEMMAMTDLGQTDQEVQRVVEMHQLSDQG